MSDIWKPELKLYAMRKSRDGTIISFVLHPNDHSSAFMAAPIGTRYRAAFVQLAEETDEPAEPKLKRISLAQLAGILCNDGKFSAFLAESYPHIKVGNLGTPDWEAAMLREICGVDSRKEFDSDSHAAKRFIDVKEAFEAWQQ